MYTVVPTSHQFPHISLLLELVRTVAYGTKRNTISQQQKTKEKLLYSVPKGKAAGSCVLFAITTWTHFRGTCDSTPAIPSTAGP